MATINNLKGTSYQSFLVGKRGTTIYQGSDLPNNIVTSPANGDIYLQKGLSSTDQALWQYVGSAWVKLQIVNANLTDITQITKSPKTVLGTDATGTNIKSLSTTDLSTMIGLGTAAYLSTGTDSGNIPVLDATGKIPVSTLPSIAITDVYSVADIDARDALTAHEGDIAIVTSNSTSYIYDGTNWQAIGSAGSVSGISGPNSSIKTGVVSLAATDILSGTFTVSQGGTGINSFKEGDLLVGTSTSTLSTIAKSTEEGDALVIKSGEIAWGKVSSQDTTFDPGVSGLSSTNTSDAIKEVSNTRVKITTSTTDPSSSTDTSLGYKIGDIIINTTTNKIFQAINVTKDSAIWQKIGTTVSPENTVYVSVSGDDTSGDGSASFPYKTITQASSKSALGSSIVIYPGTYTENISVSVEDITISSLAGNVIISGNFSTSANNTNIRNIKFTGTSSISIGPANNFIFKNCSFDSNVGIDISGAVGTGNSMIGCYIKGTVTVNSTTQNPIILKNCEGFSTVISAGYLEISDSTTIGSISHTGGTLKVSNVTEITSDSNGNSINSTANNGSNNLLYVVNSSVLQSDSSYGKILITGGTSYNLDNVIYDPTTSLTDTSRVYHTLTRDIGIDSTFTVIEPGTNLKSTLESIDSNLSKSASSAITKFTNLTDVTSYSASDANKTLQLNSTGTGVIYGPILGTAAAKNTEDFATSSQGTLAGTAVQPGQLSKVATSGDFTDLLDGPGAMGTVNASKVIRVNADGTALEYGPTMSKVATTGDYGDLSNKPVLATVATSGSYGDLTNAPVLAPVATAGFLTSLGDCPHSMTTDDTGKVLSVSQEGNSLEFKKLATVADSGLYSDLTGTPTLGTASAKNTEDFATSAQGVLAGTAVQPGQLSTVATSGKYSDLTGAPNYSDDSQDISVKSIKSDNSNILSDGAGNLNILGKLNVGTFILPSSKYDALPSTPTIGQLQLITNGRKPGEEAGAGTGVLCIFDGTIWMDISSGISVLT